MSELKTAACPGVWRDFLGCLSKSQDTLQAVFRSEPGETASSPAVPQLCSSAGNYSQLQTTTCGDLAVFLCLQNVLVPWNFRFFGSWLGCWSVAKNQCCLGERNASKKKSSWVLYMNFCLHFGKSMMLPNPGKGRVIPYQIQSPLMYIQSASLAHVIWNSHPSPGALCVQLHVLQPWLLCCFCWNKSALWGLSSLLLKPRCNDNACVSTHWYWPEKLLKMKLNGIFGGFFPTQIHMQLAPGRIINWRRL